MRVARWDQNRKIARALRRASSHMDRQGKPCGENPVAWALARAFPNPSATRERGILRRSNQTTTNRNNTRKSRKGRRKIAQRFNAGSQAIANRQVPSGLNHPERTRLQRFV